jgi:hypothetical protein
MVINLIDVYQYHSPQKKFIAKLHPFNFEIYLQFSYFVMYLFQHKYISYVQVYKCLLEFFKNKLF